MGNYNERIVSNISSFLLSLGNIMTKVANRKMKVLVYSLAGIIIGGAFFVYQKFFGGEIQNLPGGEVVVGPSKDKLISEVKKEEKVAVAYAETPALGIQDVVKKTGDLDFIQSGQKILIKPNVNNNDPAPATTHPEALAEVVRLVKSKGAYVIVGDLSNRRWKTIPAMKDTGMYKAAKEAGADEIVDFGDEEWVRVKPERAENWKKGFRIPKRLSDVDHVITVSVLHTHSITGHSLAIKNLVGLIHPRDRGFFHASTKIDEMIAEIGLAIKPSLSIIEGTKAFIKGGPWGGELVEPKVYLASKDMLAADVVGVGLLKKHGAEQLGNNLWELRQIKRAFELGLGIYGKNEINKELEKAKEAKLH